MVPQLLDHLRNQMLNQLRLGNNGKRYVGEKEDKLNDSGLRNKIIDHDMNSQAFALTLRRAAEESKSNQGPSAASSI